jgi:S1-C subfamily serine protease
MSESQLLEVIEQYLNGEMNQQEREQFELLRKQNAEIDAKVVEHQIFSNLLKQYSKRVELENRLNAIHNEIDVNDLKESLMVHPIWIVQMWRNHHSKISVAASIAIIGVLGLLFFTGKLNDNNHNNIAQLKNEVRALKGSNAKLSRSINDIKAQSGVVIRDKESSTGTGFAITSDGLIATNYHVIRGADSVYVQNDAGQSFKAQVLHTEPQNDIAILKVTDNSFDNLGTIPYVIKKSESPIAETVYTYGYPYGYPIYSPGSLSAKFGLNGDSVHYQIDIPINPGNSGGPLLDSKGNLIGITDAKQARYEGAHFAIKSKYLLDAIHNIPVDALNGKVVNLNRKNNLAGLDNVQKTKKLWKYTFMVKVY